MNVNCEWLQRKLSSGDNVIILDCRNSFDYDSKHIKSAINFSVPSILLRRLQQNKIDLLSTISRRELRDKIEKNLDSASFVLYDYKCNTSTSCIERKNERYENANSILNVLKRLLEQDNCLVFCLQGMYTFLYLKKIFTVHNTNQ